MTTTINHKALYGTQTYEGAYAAPVIDKALLPLGDRVLVMPKEVSMSEIIEVADPHKDHPRRGIVLAVSEGVPLKKGGVRPLSVAVGDAIVWSAQAGHSVMIKDSHYLLVHEADILFVEDSS